MKKIAIPTADGMLFQHFGHCPEFTFITVENNQITGTEVLPAPTHEHGSHPKFLAEQGCTDVIAGGLGDHAVQLLRQAGIEVHAGAPAKPATEVVSEFLAGTLAYGDGSCHHDGCGKHHHDIGEK